MDERLNDLLLLLRERFTAGANTADVEAFLSSQGYDGRQIGEILSLLSAEPDAQVRATKAWGQRSTAFRVQGPHERGRFAPDAWGHLLSLTAAGVVNAAELEHVIERALTHIDGRIALDDLRSMMEGPGFDESGPTAEHTIVH